jgi:mono/diheme cytochrome c family protein
MKTPNLRPVVTALLVLVAAGVLSGAALFLWIGSRGISAKADPGALETFVARTMRRLAVPSGDRDLKNPVPVTADVLAAGLSHYADHCAACHANDGSGETTIGVGLYPKPPDMRLPPTQSLTDGELFYIIENGIRLTGMPAWGDGTPEGAEGSWHLVHFIRKLPTLTPDEITQMQAMNPRSPAEVLADEEMRKFLEGEGEAPKPGAKPHSHGGHE